MENAIILDVLPSGAPFTLSQNADSQLKRRNVRAVRGGYISMPLVFGLSKTRLFLLVAVASPDHGFKTGGEIDLAEKKKIAAWARINYDDLSSAARSELDSALEKLIEGDESRFTDFFNRASPITTRMHSLELIPGIGKKHMWEIIESRRKPFKSLAEIKERLPLIADPKKGIKERILKELKGDEKYYLFVLPPRR
jgi:putative nucleotide binding protein